MFCNSTESGQLSGIKSNDPKNGKAKDIYCPQLMGFWLHLILEMKNSGLNKKDIIQY